MARAVRRLLEPLLNLEGSPLLLFLITPGEPISLHDLQVDPAVFGDGSHKLLAARTGRIPDPGHHLPVILKPFSVQREIRDHLDKGRGKAARERGNAAATGSGGSIGHGRDELGEGLLFIFYIYFHDGTCSGIIRDYSARRWVSITCLEVNPVILRQSRATSSSASSF
jgi:hypothetical protein